MLPIVVLPENTSFPSYSSCTSVEFRKVCDSSDTGSRMKMAGVNIFVACAQFLTEKSGYQEGRWNRRGLGA